MICFENNVLFDGCTLKVKDDTVYPCGTGTVEFVVYVKDNISTVSSKSIRISTNPNDCLYKYQPEIDGRYIYYKVILPYYQEFDLDDVEVNVPYGYFIASSGCKKIICLNENKSVSLLENGDEISVLKVTDLLTMVNSGLVSDFYTEEFFSICNLNNCVSLLQKKYLIEHSKDCGSLRCKKGSDTEKANRDFLFIASYLIDHYITIRDFNQAEDLLNTIQMCSDTICKNKNSVNCNCKS